MAVTLSFYSNGILLPHTLGSGLGFYGDSFGQSVRVGEWAATCWVTDSAGVSQGAQVTSNKLISSSGVAINGLGSGILLTQLPNYQATLNVRVDSDTPIKVPTASLRVYDRSNINSNPSGVTIKAAEIIHVNTSQADNSGSGDAQFAQIAGSGSVLTLAPSPGPSGFYAGNGSNGSWSDRRHDWYVSLAMSPDSVGSKLSAVYLAVEYQ